MTPSLASLSKGSAQTLLDGFQGPSFICDWRSGGKAAAVDWSPFSKGLNMWSNFKSVCQKKKRGMEGNEREGEKQKNVIAFSQTLVFGMTQAGAPLSEHKIENKLL